MQTLLNYQIYEDNNQLYSFPSISSTQIMFNMLKFIKKKEKKKKKKKRRFLEACIRDISTWLLTNSPSLHSWYLLFTKLYMLQGVG